MLNLEVHVHRCLIMLRDVQSAVVLLLVSKSRACTDKAEKLRLSKELEMRGVVK